MTREEAHALNSQLQGAYNALFATPTGKQVLADLVAYCFGRRTTFDPDPRKHAFNEGRRDVLMRIAEMTNLSLDEIYQLRGATRPQGDRDD